MDKLGAVCKDILICFHLTMTTWILGVLCRKKTLSVLSNGSMVKDGSSCSGI